MEGQTERTTERLLQAIKLFPDWGTPYTYMSNHMLGLGRLDEAVAWGLEAARISRDPMAGGPLLGVYQEFGDRESITEFIDAFPTEHPLYAAGKGYWQFGQKDYEGALASFMAFRVDAEFPVPFLIPLLASAAIMAGDFELAHETLVRGSPMLTSDSDKQVDRQNVAAAILLAHVEQQRNRPDTANRLLEQAAPIIRRLPRLGMGGHGIRDVQILTMQGRPDAAIEALTEAVDEGYISMYEKIEVMRLAVDEARAANDWSTLLARASTQ